MGQSMKKYEYENATVYITIPTEKHLQKIREATEDYLKKLLSKGVDVGEWNNDGDRGVRKTPRGKRRQDKGAARNNRQVK